MKKITIFFILFLSILMSACSQMDNPKERVDEYIQYWEKNDFDGMYNMATNKAQKDYSQEEFINRYKKIYKDIQISNLHITYEPLTKDDLKYAKREGKVTVTLHAEMDSVAGPIAFDYDADLIYEEVEKKENWYFDWNPGYIFPQLEDGGKLSLHIEEPRRGEILDRNRMPLALNDTVYEIGIVPENLGANADMIKENVAKLLNMPMESIEKELQADWVKPNLFVPLKRIPNSKENLLNELLQYDGVVKQDVMGRVYPLGEAAAHLIGYIGKITSEELEEQTPGTYEPTDMIGKRGLEQLLEERLKGKRGFKITITKEGEDDLLLAEKPVEDGENVIISIDANMQEIIYESFGGESGTAAAIHPKTGEAIALVSSPSFLPDEFLYGISQSRLDQLQNDPKKPLINRFTSTYAPGSVLKPITAAIGLENGTITPNEGIEINGLTWSNGAGWGDYKVRRVSSTNKPVDLADALMRSDNIYFAMKAVEMGVNSFSDGLKQFGFEEELPISYPFTKSSISSSGKIEGEVALANSSYGQAELEASALHLAIAYTPFLNEGNMLKPTLFPVDQEGEIWYEKVISEEDAKLMQQILRQVVEKGTAKKANRESLPISGKTGTAELKRSSNERGHENGWFIGYPTNDQDILIAMMMEHVEDKGASSYVASKVADILEKRQEQMEP